MSTAVQHRIWHFADARGTELLVLLALATYADNSGRAMPSIGLLAKKARLRIDATLDILRRLERSGEVTVTTSRGSLDVYTIAAATRTAMPTRGDE